MSCVVITSCTNRKRIAPDQGLRGASLPQGELVGVAEAWTRRLVLAQHLVRADMLYCGRGFRDAKLAAHGAGGELFIASAGLGLIPAHAKIPSYSLTITPGSTENVFSRITENCAASEWWNALISRSPFSHSLTTVLEKNSGLILVALPAAYLRMLSNLFNDLPGSMVKRLRIFSRMPLRSILGDLSGYAMPYDARFDGAGTPCPGTQMDFAQRALLHFVQRIFPAEPTGNHEAHAEAVNASIASLSARQPPNRRRISDAEVIALIHRHWDAARGQSSRMLRLLRDDLNVACEQTRFRDLFRAAKKEWFASA